MTLLQGRCLGGTTVINNAICFRMNDDGLYQGMPDTLESWRALGARIDRGGLRAAYERVESMLGVRSLPEVHDARVSSIEGSNGRVLLDGWRRLTERDAALPCYPSGLFRKNLHHCLGCGYCNFGCPYGRRLSVLETYIPQAIGFGAQVITSCHAVGIDTRDGKAMGVRCERRDGSPLYVRAEQVVVSCGAIGSSVLLMKSGVRRNVGWRFSFNAGTPVFARFPKPIHGYDGDQIAAYIDAGDFLLESLFNPPLAFAATLPGWFDKHFDRMKAYDRLACAGVLVGTDHNARVKRTHFWRDLFGPVVYTMTAADLNKMKRGVALLARVFFEAGAEAVYPSTFADVELNADDVRSHPEAIMHLLDTWIRAPEDLTLNSSHPQGGNAMSDETSIGVVDSHFRVHGYSNLYVCDASIFPTTIRVNPQLTIMAMADYFCHLGEI
jgi:choline dehydrogenase-like flavoprotein